MSDTTFKYKQTSITSAWLQDVNDRTYRDIINVKNAPYSAKGDGTTDDTGAIQSALNYLSSNGGGVLFFPPGNYQTSGVSLSYTSGSQAPVSLLGCGKRVSVITKIGTTTNPVFSFSSTVSLLDMYQFIKDMSIVGNNFSSVHDGISYTDWAKFKLDSVEFRYCNNGINASGLLVGIIENCQLISNNTGAIFRKSSGNVYNNNITFIGGVISANNKYGVDFDQGSGLAFIGTDIESNGTSTNIATTTGGIRIGPNVTAETGVGLISFENCHFESNSGWSIQSDSTGNIGDIVFKNCLIFSSQNGQCIYLPSASQVTLEQIKCAGTSDTVNISADYAVIKNSRIAHLTDTNVSRKDYTGLTTSAGINNQVNAFNAPSAWVRFDGTTSPPNIIDGYNVSSVSLLSTGNYRVFFSKAMTNTNYFADPSGENQSTDKFFAYNRQAGSVDIETYNSSTGDTNKASVQLVVYTTG